MRKRGRVKFFIAHLLVILTVCRSTVGRNRLTRRRDHPQDENVGSVLFDRNNAGKVCWEVEELILLNSRRIFQDILPQVSVIDTRNDTYIGLLMDYMDICLEAVRGLTSGKTKHLVLKALADTLAGYLRVYILPMTKRSYYAGNIKYRKAKRLFDLYDELKVFLRSNGVGWRRPREFHQHLDVTAVDVPLGKSDQDCTGLILYPAFFIGFRVFPGSDRSVQLPMPYLDDESNPNSIALPFEVASLSSLFTEESAFVLVKYYAAGEKCLSSRSTKGQLEIFQRQLFDWIHQHVNPHLEEEKWYPGFGGVLKILASLEATGLKPSKNVGHEPPRFPGKAVPNVLPQFPPMNTRNESLGRRELVIVAVASALLIWLLLGMSLICWKILATHSSKSPEDTPVAVLYENRKYPSPDISSPSEGGIFTRLKNRFRRKSPDVPRCECPSDDDDDCDEERCLGSMSYSTDDTDRLVIKKKPKKRTKFTSIPSNATRSDKKSYYSTDESSSSERRERTP
ncbi:uncharacterized protein [Fopius arisanus]|uniref:Uncharacterized protein isoform X2 n=1 Tax=Fopius arisanus TaxID=64838 RepID=A0A9R1TTM4_9HYME|nr:PREDICTED: uncharacterized protein LOC105273839 isoform X2 [Fopius arisanus]